MKKILHPAYILGFVICVLAILLAQPVYVEIAGHSDFGLEMHKATITGSVAKRGYSDESASEWRDEYLEIHTDNGKTLTFETNGGVPEHADNAVGLIGNRVVNFNGKYVGEMSDGNRVMVAIVTSLLAIQIFLVAFSREVNRELDKIKPSDWQPHKIFWYIFAAVMFLALPTMIAYVAGVVLDLLFEIAWWPPIVIGVYVITALAVALKIRRKKTGSATPQPGV